MTETKYFTIPAGYIVLSRADYDDIIEQRVSNRIDRTEDEAELLSEINRLQAIVDSRDREIADLKKDLESLAKREKEISYKLFQANETNLALRSEIRLLNDELCRTDEIMEATYGIPQE